MKKALFLVAVATLALLSCQKENGTTEQTVNHGITFKASIEGLSDDTKATLNSSRELVWAENDKIGVYVNDGSWTDKNQPFTLVGTGGDVEGEFAWDYDSGNFTNTNATAAFFPWQGTGTDKNNVFDGVAYFKLPEAYWSYDNNKMLTPLVASITSSGTNVNQPIKFKHAGAAVKLTINNLYTGTYKVKMSVSNKQITGDFHVDPANAGTDALALDAAENTSKNTVTLNTWKGNGAFNWIFPVPELTKPKLSFEIIDNNGITVWSRNLKAQTNDVKRGEVLAMPALDITPYSKFVQDDAHTWSFSGTINGSSWTDNVPMVSDGKYWILAGCTFVVGDEFKIRQNEAWTVAYPENNWKFTTETGAGAKDIIFNSETHEITVVNHGFPYPESDLSSLSSSSSITIDGDMTDWSLINALPSTQTSRIRSWKFASDADNLYFYFSLRKNRSYTGKHLVIGFNTDNDDATGWVYDSNKIYGLEAQVSVDPFTNASGAEPVCVNGLVSGSEVKASTTTNGVVCVWGYDAGEALSSDDSSTYIELSIPRDKLDLPAAGSTITIGCAFDYYVTGPQSITL